MSGGVAYIPYVRTDGAMEVESQIDYHNNGSITDYDSRLGLDKNGMLICSGEFKGAKVWGAVAN